MGPKTVHVATGRRHDDLRARNLAQAWMRTPDDPRFPNTWESVDARLHLFGEELEPADEDDGLRAALEVKRTGLVDPADVAGEEPAFARDLFAALPWHVIGGEEPRAAEPDFAGGSRGERPSVLGERPDLVAGDGPTDRGGREPVGREVDAGQPGLDDPVSLCDRHS